jgi:hypothetical protein
MVMMLLNEMKYVAGCSILKIPMFVAFIVALIFQGIRVILPIIILIKATMDLGKAEANKKEMAMAKTKFVRALLKATIIFIILTFVQFGINLLTESVSSTDTWTCIQELIYF